MTTDARLEPFGVLGLDFLLAIEERLNAAFALFRFVRIKSVFDGAQDYMQRHAAFFPAFNQGPIDRTKHQMLAAAANERVFDF